MKFDQDLRLNLRYDFGKMKSTLGSVVPLAMFTSFLFFCINNKSRITHLKLTGTDMIVKEEAATDSAATLDLVAANLKQVLVRKNILGYWLTTDSDLMLCVLSFWQKVFQTSDSNYLLILPPRLVVTNLQQFRILIAIRDN